MGKEIRWMAVTLFGNRKVPRSQVFRIMGYGRKPLCPRCGNPLSVVSEGATGFANMKCIRCKPDWEYAGVYADEERSYLELPGR